MLQKVVFSKDKTCDRTNSNVSKYSIFKKLKSQANMCQFFAKLWPEKQFSCKKMAHNSGDFKSKISKFPNFYGKFQLLAKKDSAFFLSSYLVGSQIWLNVLWSSREFFFPIFSGQRIGKYCQKSSKKYSRWHWKIRLIWNFLKIKWKIVRLQK